MTLAVKAGAERFHSDMPVSAPAFPAEEVPAVKDQAQNSGRCDPTSVASAVGRMVKPGGGGFVPFVFFKAENIANHFNSLCYFYLYSATLDYSTVVKGKISYPIFIITLYPAFKTN